MANKQIPLKGSSISPILIKHFKSFDEFYRYADPIYKGSKKEFEQVYFEVMPKKSKEGAE